MTWTSAFKRYRNQFILLFILFKVSFLFAKNDSISEKYIQHIDKQIEKLQPSSVSNVKNIQKDRGKEVYPDIYFEYRIEKLDKSTPIKLDYNNDVRRYIDIYLNERRENVSQMLGLAQVYFPIFEECLARYNLPLELKYLAVVESALNPLAVSSSGAVGLWQMLYNSSKLFGLEINSYIDERSDPYKSTDAACRYLKYLYGIFNDWQLAISAYNSGPGEIRNAIIRSGGKTNFWELQAFLPEQTKKYLPAFIAVNYIFNHADEHGIQLIPATYTYLQSDTLMINEAVSFSQISERLKIPVATLKQMNPAYKLDFIPDAGKPCILVLPSNKTSAFLKTENSIYAQYIFNPTYIDNLKNSGDTSKLVKHYYYVKAGDFLHKIALANSCTIENLRSWNQLTSDNLNTNQRLKIWLPLNQKLPIDTIKISTDTTKIIYYTVRKGDTVWSIAEKFKYNSVDSLKDENNITNEKGLQTGQVIKIKVKSEK